MVLLQRILYSIAAVFWSATGVTVSCGMVKIGGFEGARVVGALMLVNAAAFGAAGWLSLRGYRLIDYGAILLVTANGVLSVTDDVGLLDIASLILCALLLALTVLNRRAASRASETERTGP
jgi:hypothetical protein